MNRALPAGEPLRPGRHVGGARPEREIGDAVEPEQESLTFAVVATGVLVLVAPTTLQVMWLLVLVGALVAITQRRARRLEGPGDRGVDGGGRPRARQP
ncbi:MAG: hypothetical protein QOE59_3375 [Actinomycetota bacterium]|jgi:hypothetical protein|nr:hypothetical protein [Actinomycetota bacterium]